LRGRVPVAAVGLSRRAAAGERGVEEEGSGGGRRFEQACRRRRTAALRGRVRVAAASLPIRLLSGR
jgi:hypothetical protein